MSKQGFLKKAIEDESEGIKAYGQKPKGLNGKISGIRRDEMRHREILKSAKQKLESKHHGTPLRHR